MDFREHWLAYFIAVVDAEIAAAGGRDADGYKAVGLKLEKSKDTIYQHYKRKSGKVFPTVEMMVMLEKKYGDGRAVGWSSQPPERSTHAGVASAGLSGDGGPTGPTAALLVLGSVIQRMDDPGARKGAVGMLHTYIDDPAGNGDMVDLIARRLAGEMPAVEQAKRTGTN